MSAYGGTIGGDALPKERKGGVPVNIQDQTTPPVDAYFAQQIGTFLLASDTVESTMTVLNYTFVATPAHTLAPGDEILLLDVAANREFYAIVQNVVVTVITVDRPIDHVFPAPGLNEIVTTNMAVNGSLVTPQIFAIQVGSIEVDVTRILITIEDDVAMDSSKFGSLAALTNGFVFRIVNSFNKTVFCFKTNGEIQQMCYDVQYIDRAAPGLYGFGARITFAGQDKHGVTLRISNSDQLQWVVQDNLTTLSKIAVSLQGHLVTD